MCQTFGDDAKHLCAVSILRNSIVHLGALANIAKSIAEQMDEIPLLRTFSNFSFLGIV